MVTVPGGPRSAFDRHIGHRRHFTPAALRSLLSGAGFDVERVTRAGFPFFNLYRLAVIARGRKLIEDLESARRPTRAAGPGGRAGVLRPRPSASTWLRTPFGWQLVARGPPPGTRLGAMIISRTPLRITLGGGGTDLPSYYGQHGGFVISAAINRYIFIAINRTFSDDYFLKYSELERVQPVDDIEHPIIREALRLHPIGPSIELVSVADIPAGTGLGLVGGLHGRACCVPCTPSSASTSPPPTSPRRRAGSRSRSWTGPWASRTSTSRRSAGSRASTSTQDGNVTVSPLLVSNDTLRDLEEHLCMFFTGYSRPADRVLDEQRTKSNRGDADMVDSLHFVKENGLASRRPLSRRGDTARVRRAHGRALAAQAQRSAIMSNERIDRCYQIAMESGALGGKLVGAGSGGFLLFYAKDLDSVRAAMAAEGLYRGALHLRLRRLAL